MKLKNSKKAGFTLIELLVVMGIIVILAAMIIPKVGGARGKALQVSCSSNLRNIAKSMQLYVEDYPNVGCPGYGIANATTKEIFGSMYYRADDKSGGLTALDLYVCPALKDDNSHKAPVQGATGWHAALGAAAASNQYIDYCVLTAHTTAGVFPDFRNDPDENAVLTEMDIKNHGEGLNVAFIAGHVKYLTKAEFEAYQNVNPSSGAKYAETISQHHFFLSGGDGTYTAASGTIAGS